jgi:hypothetical protein
MAVQPVLGIRSDRNFFDGFSRIDHFHVAWKGLIKMIVKTRRAL